jgi:hypothetical protein
LTKLVLQAQFVGASTPRRAELEQTDHPEAFEQEVRYNLVGFDEPGFVAETSLEYLSARCDFLIQERGYDPWEKN